MVQLGLGVIVHILTAIQEGIALVTATEEAAVRDTRQATEPGGKVGMREIMGMAVPVELEGALATAGMAVRAGQIPETGAPAATGMTIQMGRVVLVGMVETAREMVTEVMEAPVGTEVLGTMAAREGMAATRTRMMTEKEGKAGKVETEDRTMAMGAMGGREETEQETERVSQVVRVAKQEGGQVRMGVRVAKEGMVARTEARQGPEAMVGVETAEVVMEELVVKVETVGTGCPGVRAATEGPLVQGVALAGMVGMVEMVETTRSAVMAVMGSRQADFPLSVPQEAVVA